MKNIIVACLCLIAWQSLGWAQEEYPLNDQRAKDSYSLGYDFGANIKRQGVEVDLSVLLQAVQEGLERRKPVLDYDEIRNTLVEMLRRLMIRQDQNFREFAAKNFAEGKAFLEANKVKEGVKTLPSGLQYRVLVEGKGLIPKASDSVTVHYRGTLISGQEFDSSYGRGEPETLTVGGMIAGWQEALQLMKTGSKWRIFVPSDLAYGQRNSTRIPPNSTLVFELELLAVNETSAPKDDELSTASE